MVPLQCGHLWQHCLILVRSRENTMTRRSSSTSKRPDGRHRHRLWHVSKRVGSRIGEDNISIMAAGVAFYALLSIFPGLTTLISLYGLVADPDDVRKLIESARGVLPDEALSLLTAQVSALLHGGPGKFGLGLVISLAFALWSTNYGTASLITALNAAYEEKETRGYVRATLTGLALTTGLVVFGILSLLLVAVLPVAIDLLPVPPGWDHIIGFVRWPILVVLTMAALAVIYRLGPSKREARWRWVSWGAVIATAVWIVVSAGFSLYVARFASYDKTYGSLGAVVILMMWLYLTAYVILLGAELDAELEQDYAGKSKS
jgi:membrane protein